MEYMEGFEIPKEAFEKLKDPDLVKRQVSEGRTFQEILEYTQEKMDKFYEIARNLFAVEEYEKASDAFIFLTTLNPYMHSYWLGLGMTEQLKGDYQGALLAYSMAILTELDSPLPHYHSASCYIALNDKASAMNSLKAALEFAERDDKHRDLYKHVQVALQRLT